LEDPIYLLLLLLERKSSLPPTEEASEPQQQIFVLQRVIVNLSVFKSPTSVCPIYQQSYLCFSPESFSPRVLSFAAGSYSSAAASSQGLSLLIASPHAPTGSNHQIAISKST
jgi:hypothetical protein